jgi:hypothetical protein
MYMFAIALAAGVAVMFSACEKDKDSNTGSLDEASLFGTDLDSEFDEETSMIQPLSPEPKSGAIDTVGDVLTFRVSGGRRPYTWAVGTAAAGTLNKTTTQNDSEGIQYTAKALAANTIVVTDVRGRAAVIDISAGTKTLSINPTSVSFLATELDGANVQVQFQASGGVSPYTWSDSLPGYGDIDGNGLWTSDNTQTAVTWSNKTVTVTVEDSNGSTASATIIAN